MFKHLTTNFVVNAVVFQTCWLACVVGSAYGLTWPSLISFVTLAVWQLHPSRRAPTDFKLLFAALILGLLVDSLWVQIGLLEFTTQWPNRSVAPAWILMLWLGFALTVNHSLAWLKAHPLLPALMGLIGGPLAYFAGLKFGAVTFAVDPLLMAASLGIAWALSMVILVRLSHYEHS